MLYLQYILLYPIITSYLLSTTTTENFPTTHHPQCIEFLKNQPSMLYIIPRNGDSRSAPIMKVPVDGHFNFHFSNAYEDEATNEIHIDVVWV